MNPLELVPLMEEDQAPPLRERGLTIGVGDVRYGCAVASHVVKGRLLSSLHVFAEQEDLWDTAIGKPRVSRDNPFLNERETADLDEYGLIRKGTRVATNDVLASIVVADLRPSTRRQAPPEEGKQWVTDRSWRVPSGWEQAVVTSARRLRRQELGRGSPKGLRERIEIVLRLERPLQIGDVLFVTDRALVVSSFRDTAPVDNQGAVADIVVPPDVAHELGVTLDRFLQLPVSKGDVRAEDVLQARSVGPYSLITQGPLARPPYGGQSISAAHIEWLRQRGLSALVGELVSVKCDDVFDRPQLESLAEQTAGTVLDLDRPAAPQSLAEIVAYLSALGLHVDLQSGDSHVCVGIRPATADEIVERSAGEITKPETIHYQTYEDLDDGLFAPNVFGPTNWSRRQRFGHFNLAIPIVPFLWRVGSPSLLSRATGLGEDDIERVVKHQCDVIWRGDEPCLEDRSQEDHDNKLGTGARAIEAILARRPKGNVPEGIRGVVSSLTTSVLPVLPPDWRPLVLLDNGNFATSDLNDLYRRVINRSKRLAKLLELNAPPVILDNESRELQEAADSLFSNALLPTATGVVGTGGKRLVDILLLIFRRMEQQEKRVDWSGAARVIPDDNVPSDQVFVPSRIFETLRLNEQLPLLLTLPSVEARFVSRLPRRHDDPVFRVSRDTYEQLGGTDVLAPIAQVHRPVTKAGRDEALGLLREGGKLNEVVGGGTALSWIDCESADELASKLVATATTGELTPFSSPRGLLIGGTGSTQFAADAEQTSVGEQRRQASIPEEEQIRFSEPSFDQMMAVARSHVRKACVFEARRTDQSPPAAKGRIGGEPFLPPGVEWPYLYGKPLPFLGQFPLDPAREAGLLPIDVPPASMLTVFGGYDCWDPGPCEPRCPVFIHSTVNLKATPVPSDLEYPIELSEISPTIVEETPDWPELKEILNWELDRPKRGLLVEFRKKHWPQLQSATDGIKIGGWAKWIQDTDSSAPVLLQLGTVDDADFMFGDSGTLYIVVEEGGEFTCFTQCY